MPEIQNQQGSVKPIFKNSRRQAVKRKVYDGILKGLIWLCAAITMAVLIWIIVYVVINGLPFITWEFVSTEIMPMIVSTVFLILLSVVIATPIGIGSAIYLVEYAKQGKIVKTIRFATESLAGIPSIIYGLFGMIFFVGTMGFGYSLLSGALTLSIMVLPTIIRTTEETLKAVPDSFREGSLGLGATKLRTIFKIVLPSALSGIITAVILTIGRIVGETAAVYLTAGMVPNMPSGIMSSGRTLSVHLYMLASEATGADAFGKAFATATILILVVLVINFLANLAAKRLRKGL